MPSLEGPAGKPLGSLNDEAFDYDDYADVFQTYFAEITRAKSWDALPAGWHNPYSSAAAAFIPSDTKHVELERYALDEGYALERPKTHILSLVSAWERQTIEYSALTLFPSVSSANLGTMIALADLGFRRAIFETPAYYASIDQARSLNLELVRIPSFRSEQFETDLSRFEVAVRRAEPCSLWLTQPRFGIGTNQNPERVVALANILGPQNVLVIDEAVEQCFPSTLSNLPSLRCPIVRTRGLLKGIGLNGMRIAFAIHPSEWRGAFEHALETTGSSLDRFSLTNAEELSQDVRLFSSLLKQANDQVREFQNAVSISCTGTPIEPTDLTNGYMGVLIINLAQIKGTYHEKRNALLSACKSRRMPVVLKASVGFAKDETWEGIRLNYFTTRANVIRSAEILNDALHDAQVSLE